MPTAAKIVVISEDPIALMHAQSQRLNERDNTRNPKGVFLQKSKSPYPRLGHTPVIAVIR